MPEVHNTSAQLVLSKTVRLTAADILALGATPFQLVPAPGAGKLVVPFGVVFVYQFGTKPYQTITGASDHLMTLYSPSGDDVGASISGLLTPGTSEFAYVGAFTGPSAVLPGDDNSAIVLRATHPYTGGPIVTATKGAGGAGYAINDTGTIDTGNGDATYKVLTVDGAGAVLTFSITAPGSSYAVGNGLTTTPGGAQPGAGAGFTVNITAVQNGDGTLKVTTFYSIIPVP